MLPLTGIAPAIGAHLSGLLFGLFSFGAFFLVIASGLSRWGIGPAFVAAIVVAVVIQGLTLRATR